MRAHAPPPRWPGPRPGRRRARRGAIRASLPAAAGRAADARLRADQELEQRTGGRWRPSPGSVYPTLAQLEDEGLVPVVDDEGRKRFELTDAGRTWLDEHPERAERRPWEQRWRRDAAATCAGSAARSSASCASSAASARRPSSSGPGRSSTATRDELYEVLADSAGRRARTDDVAGLTHRSFRSERPAPCRDADPVRGILGCGSALDAAGDEVDRAGHGGGDEALQLRRRRGTAPSPPAVACDPVRAASSVAARDVFTAWAWTMNAVVVSSSARRCSACAGGAPGRRAEVDRRPARRPRCATRGGRSSGPGTRTTGPGGRCPGCRASVGGVPAGGVGVRQAVGDVEPAEVVVEVELAGRVVAQHALGHGVDDDVEHAVDAGAVAQRGDRGVQRRRRGRRRPSSAARSVPSSRHDGSASSGAQGVEVDAGERLGERPHVRQRVLACAVDDRRHEVRQHGVGPLPAEPSSSWNAFWA